jgi:hypothetical protein
VLDYLFGQSYQQNCQQEFINEIISTHFITQEHFWSNGEGYIRFALCVKEEKNTRGD